MMWQSIKAKVVNPTDVCRSETKMDMVRAQSSTTKWDEIEQLMVANLYEKPVLDGFCEVVVHTTNYFNEMKLHHMLTLYTLFVDVISCYVQKQQCRGARWLSR